MTTFFASATDLLLQAKEKTEGAWRPASLEVLEEGSDSGAARVESLRTVPTRGLQGDSRREAYEERREIRIM